ncbi:MAG: M48 family peptidase, partial [Salegentibacter mishustinae]|nr:M48 family peptidase [Salegentibacter mishustinae]
MKLKKSISIVAVLLLVVACKTNPFTGEKNLNFVSNDQLFPSSFEQYDQFLSENEVVTGTAESQMIKRVGNKIETAAERYLNA